MKKILFLLLITLTSCRAQKSDTLKLVSPIKLAETVKGIDIEVVLLSQIDLQQKVLMLEDLAIKNGWIVQSKFGVLNAKDVSQFQTFTETQLSKTYTADILKRFAESLKISVLGTKATLIKSVKAEVIKRSQ